MRLPLQSDKIYQFTHCLPHHSWGGKPDMIGCTPNGMHILNKFISVQCILNSQTHPFTSSASCRAFHCTCIEAHSAYIVANRYYSLRFTCHCSICEAFLNYSDELQCKNLQEQDLARLLHNIVQFGVILQDITRSLQNMISYFHPGK